MKGCTARGVRCFDICPTVDEQRGNVGSVASGSNVKGRTAVSENRPGSCAIAREQLFYSRLVRFRDGIMDGGTETRIYGCCEDKQTQS